MTQIDEPKEESIQPIKSHTEILIQQAYDRGYADKAMKVDQAIEMEHSAKGCTEPCHSEPNLDEQLSNLLTDYLLGCRPITKDTVTNGKKIMSAHKHARESIKALIATQIQEARIEALQWALNDYNMSDTDTRANLEEYIAQLRQAIKGDK